MSYVLKKYCEYFYNNILNITVLIDIAIILVLCKLLKARDQSEREKKDLGVRYT